MAIMRTKEVSIEDLKSAILRGDIEVRYSKRNMSVPDDADQWRIARIYPYSTESLDEKFLCMFPHDMDKRAQASMDKKTGIIELTTGSNIIFEMRVREGVKALPNPQGKGKRTGTSLAQAADALPDETTEEGEMYYI